MAPSLSDKLTGQTRSSRIFGLFGAGMPIVASVIWIGGTILQGAQISGLRQDIQYLKNRPVAVQVGKNRTLVLGAEIQPDQNRADFLLEALTNLFAMTPYQSKKERSDCLTKAKAQKDEKAFKECDAPSLTDVPGVGVLSNQTLRYQLTLTPQSQKPVLKFIASLMPPNVDKGNSRLLSISSISSQEETPNGYKLAVVATLDDFGLNNVRTNSSAFDFWVYIEPYLAPPPAASPTPLQALISTTLSRGWRIAKVVPVK